MTEDTKQTIDYTIGKLQAAAEALEPGARRVYEVLVRQAWVVGITDALFALVCAGIVALVVIKYKALLEWSANGPTPSYLNDRPIVVTFVMIGGVAASVAFAITASSALRHMINPEYYALKDILGAL